MARHLDDAVPYRAVCKPRPPRHPPALRSLPSVSNFAPSPTSLILALSDTERTMGLLKDQHNGLQQAALGRPALPPYPRPLVSPPK